MIKKIKNLYQKEYFPVIFFCFLFLVLMLPRDMIPGTDDDWNYSVYVANGPWYLFQYFNDWQARIVNNFLAAFFGFRKIPWIPCTILVVTMTFLLMYKVSSVGAEISNKRHIAKIVCMGYFLVNESVIVCSIYWYSGSFQYAYPALYLFVALLPFYYKLCGYNVEHRITAILAILCAGLAAYTEQTVAILICFGIITLFILKFYHEPIPKYLIGELIFALLNLGVYFYFGGQGTRSTAELHYYPNFDMISTFEKIYQGINWGNYQLFNTSNILYFLLVLLVAAVYMCKDDSKLTRVMSSIPAIVFAARLFPVETIFQNLQINGTGNNFGSYLSTGINYLFNTNYEVPGDITDFTLGFAQLLPGFLGLAFVLYIGGLLLSAFHNQREGIAVFLLYFGGLAASYVLGLSPVVYEAGNRIFFITDLLMICVVGSLFKELLGVSKDKRKIMLGFGVFGIIAALSAFNHLYHNYVIPPFLW